MSNPTIVVHCHTCQERITGFGSGRGRAFISQVPLAVGSSEDPANTRRDANLRPCGFRAKILDLKGNTKTLVDWRRRKNPRPTMNPEEVGMALLNSKPQYGDLQPDMAADGAMKARIVQTSQVPFVGSRVGVLDRDLSNGLQVNQPDQALIPERAVIRVKPSEDPFAAGKHQVHWESPRNESLGQPVLREPVNREMAHEVAGFLAGRDVHSFGQAASLAEHYLAIRKLSTTEIILAHKLDQAVEGRVKPDGTVMDLDELRRDLQLVQELIRVERKALAEVPALSGLRMKVISTGFAMKELPSPDVMKRLLLAGVLALGFVSAFPLKAQALNQESVKASQQQLTQQDAEREAMEDLGKKHNHPMGPNAPEPKKDWGNEAVFLSIALAAFAGRPLLKAFENAVNKAASERNARMAARSESLKTELNQSESR